MTVMAVWDNLVSTKSAPRCVNSRGHGPRSGTSMSSEHPSVPYGYCHCGCGQKTNLAKRTRSDRRQVRGEPCVYLPGHVGSHRQPNPLEWVEEDRGHDTPCWIYQGQFNEDGYGLLGHGRGSAHRMVYVNERGPVSPGLELDHLCRVRACVNPDHLEPVTHAENVRRGDCAKLNYEIACDLRERYARWQGTQTSFLAEWAKALNVTRGAIEHVINGRTWRPPENL